MTVLFSPVLEIKELSIVSNVKDSPVKRTRKWQQVDDERVFMLRSKLLGIPVQSIKDE